MSIAPTMSRNIINQNVKKEGLAYKKLTTPLAIRIVQYTNPIVFSLLNISHPLQKKGP